MTAKVDMVMVPRELALRLKQHLYNGFEPDNQSRIYMDLKAACAASTAPERWQPIETAPADTAILIYAQGYRVAHFNSMAKRWIGYGANAETHILNTWAKPTHWMPLPAAPAHGGDK